MNTKFINVLMFAAGAAIGSLATWKVVKTKYERIAQEEIDSVKERFSLKYEHKGEPIAKVESIEVSDEGLKATATFKPYQKPDLFEYAKILQEEGYTDYSESTVEEKGGSNSANRPYLISPDEFGEMDGYESISYTWYEDGILADDQGIVIEDVDDIVGLDNLQRFGEYEEDAVHVRNDERREDYEILLSLKEYYNNTFTSLADVDDPYQGGDE